MITKAEGYKTSDGAILKTLPEAQANEIRLLWAKADTRPELPMNEWIVVNKDALMGILSIEVPKKRTRKPRAAKASTQPALTP